MDYVGNIYNDPQQIINKIDQRIDQNYSVYSNCIQQYTSFTSAPSKYDGLYFEDINLILTPELIIFIEKNQLLDSNINKEELNDRVYTIYAAGLAKNVYAIKGLDAFSEIIDVLNNGSEDYIHTMMNLKPDRKALLNNYKELFKQLARKKVRSDLFKTNEISFTKIPCTEQIWNLVFG